MSERMDQFVKTATAQSELEKKAIEMIKPFIAPAIAYTLSLYIYLWILEKYGFERVIISLLLIIILLLRWVGTEVLKNGSRSS